MRSFNAVGYARQLVAATAGPLAVRVMDDDGRLVIRVYQGRDVVGLHDTGLPGHADPAPATALAQSLVDALSLLGWPTRLAEQ